MQAVSGGGFPKPAQLRLKTRQALETMSKIVPNRSDSSKL
jgi:hypothetical protein